ncbi:MAG: hypothetical protein JWR50_1416 [Mucilaginibacter sp.]|nr:hypothetical protein [Mucilaginibacter sp.]
MKKFYTTLAAVLAIVQISNAQWNTSAPNQITYTSGNVGIGTLSPVYPLDVLTNINGTVAVQFTNANNGSAARTRFQLNNGVVYALINLNSSTYPIDPNSLQISSPGALTLNTGALERMRITPAGNVGIGTATPSKSLTVYPQGSGGVLIGNPTTGSGNYTSLLLGVSADKNGYPYLQGTQSAGLYNGKLLLNPFGGRVGVSSTTPISTFQVGDNIGKASLGMANGANLGYGTSYLGFNAARDSSWNWTVASDGTHNGGGVIWGGVSGDIYFAPLMSNGNTTQTLTDSQIKSMICFSITAAGVAHAKQVVVSLTNWPDYVFKKDYALPPLSEVKTYIDQNKHLPEMPSETDVVKEGINLGEMIRLQTKKIEELTLYLIDKDKQIEIQGEQSSVQQKQIKDQNKAIQSLQQQMDKLEKKLNN